MNVRSRRTKGDVVAAMSRLGQRQQIVIPEKPADPDDVLTPEEAELVRKGEAQLRRGQFVTLEQLEHDLDRQARKGSRKAV
jgi:hypothetical protein